MKTVFKFLLYCILAVGILGVGYFAFGCINDKEEIDNQKHSEFSMMIDEYKVPTVKFGVASLIKSHEFFTDTVSVVCKINDFDGKRMGFLGDVSKHNNIKFIFRENDIPNGLLWRIYLTEIKGSDKEFIVHGKLLKEKENLYFVIQRIYSTDNTDLEIEIQKILDAQKKQEKNKAF